jgi:2'-5' RNA ligase
MNYSIWVVPPEPIFSQLQEIIDSLSQKYDSPRFNPHMTILGTVDRKLEDVQNAAKVLVGKLSNLKLSLGPVSFSTTYYQSVFVRVISTTQLMQLNLDLKKSLNLENSVFMPHISLFYGDHDMKTREKIASGTKIEPVTFSISKLLIIPENSTPLEWQPVATIPFGRH